jgi:hypothetical protein
LFIDRSLNGLAGGFMKIGAFEALFPFGLLVISDPGTTDTHDDWDPSIEKVHAGIDSLYVGVRDAASGLVAVTCVDDAESSGIASNVMFSGQLELPTSRLKFYDPDESICMTVPVMGSSVTVVIHADDVDEPSDLLVRVTPYAHS